MSHSCPEVIALLEHYLEAARQSPRCAISISMVRNNGSEPQVMGSSEYAGEIALESYLLRQIDAAKSQLSVSVDACTLPLQDHNLDASHVVYNMATGPLGFDFIVWLVDAEMKRIAAGAPAPLKVGFWVGTDTEREANHAKRQKWLQNVFRPALYLIGAVEDNNATRGNRNPSFVPRDIVKACKSGRQVPKFRKLYRSYDEPYVTITLREAEHWPERNSRIEDWIRFARYLQTNGEKVIFVRDTAKARETIEGFETSPWASQDLVYRTALYQHAKANLFRSNGPAIMAVFSECPWLQFMDPVDEKSSFSPNHPSFWTNCMGITPPEQYPWSAPDQRFIWAPDTYDNLVAAWHEHIEPTAEAA